MPTPEISDEAELLGLLRAAPALRAVGYPDNQNPAVCECRGGDPAKLGKILAWVREEGTAWKLLDRAYEADREEAKSLPVVYGPYCSTWVLPEHPLAFTDGTDRQAPQGRFLEFVNLHTGEVAPRRVDITGHSKREVERVMKGILITIAPDWSVRDTADETKAQP